MPIHVRRNCILSHLSMSASQRTGWRSVATKETNMHTMMPMPMALL
jgi:hypothetical protein